MVKWQGYRHRLSSTMTDPTPHNQSTDTPHLTREALHHRQIDLHFYRLSNGDYEVVGRVIDTKSHAFRLQLATEDLPAGSPIHDIEVRMVVDETLIVKEASAQMRSTPFGVCQGAKVTLGPIVGLQIAAGWNKRVRELLGGTASCTHIMELLGPMATTVLQGVAPKRIAEIDLPHNEAMRRAKVNTCFAYSDEREVVAKLWPHLAKPKR